MSDQKFWTFQDLIRECGDRFLELLSVSNAVALFRLAHQHRLKELRKESGRLIIRNFNTIKVTEDWLSLMTEPGCGPIISEILDQACKHRHH